MAESGPSLSEIRLPKHTSDSPPGPKHPEPQPANRPPRPNTWGERLKSIGLRFTGEEPYKPENFTSEKIAGIISARVKNPLLEKAGRNPYTNGFSIRDILSNSGHVRSMGDPNSPAYQATRQALYTLTQNGVLEEIRYEEPHHGEFTRYRVIDPLKLMEATHPEEPNPNQ